MITMRSVPSFFYKLGAWASVVVVLPAVILILLGHLMPGLLWLLTLPLWLGLMLWLCRPLMRLPQRLHHLQQNPVDRDDRYTEAILNEFRELARHAEHQARQGQHYESLYQTLWSRVTSGILLLDSQRHILSVNPALCSLCGYEEQELAGQGDEILWAPDDRQLVELVWQEFHAMPDSAVRLDSHSLRLIHKDGSTSWVELGLQELPAACAPFRYLLLVRDISGQKQALDLLHLERRKSLTLLDLVSEALVLTDELGRVQYLNPAAAELFATGQEAVSGQFLWPLLSLYRQEGKELRELEGWLPAPGLHTGLVLLGASGEQRSLELLVASVREDETQAGLRVMLFRERAEVTPAGTLDWAQSHDRLTGLANRAAFEVRLEECLHQGPERTGPTVVALVDLDHFRELNDRGGREVGDQMLQQVARILLHDVRRCDLVARLGADEFALLLTGCDSQRALLITEGIRADLEKYRLEVGGQQFRITASIGLTELSPRDRDIQQILRRADEGCSRSKAQGRNLVSLVEATGVEIQPAHQNS